MGHTYTNGRNRERKKETQSMNVADVLLIEEGIK
jgi:hypothetical protein